MIEQLVRRRRRLPPTFVTAVLRHHQLTWWWWRNFNRKERRLIMARASSVYRVQMQRPGHVWLVPHAPYDALLWVSTKLQVKATRELGLRWVRKAITYETPEPHDELGDAYQREGLIAYHYYDRVLEQLAPYAKLDDVVTAELERIAALQVITADEARRALTARWAEYGPHPLKGGEILVAALHQQGRPQQAETLRRKLEEQGWLGFRRVTDARE